MVMEMCEACTLKDLLTRSMASGKRAYKVKQACDWLLQVALAMEYLHGRAPVVIHRDLRPDHVLLKREPDGELTCKLTELGLHMELAGPQSGRPGATSMKKLGAAVAAFPVAGGLSASAGTADAASPTTPASRSPAGISEIQEAATTVMENPSFLHDDALQEKMKRRAAAAAAATTGNRSRSQAAAAAVASSSAGPIAEGCEDPTDSAAAASTAAAATAAAADASISTVATKEGGPSGAGSREGSKRGAAKGSAEAALSAAAAAAGLTADSVGWYRDSLATHSLQSEFAEEPVWVPSPAADKGSGEGDGDRPSAMFSMLLSDQAANEVDPGVALRHLRGLMTRMGVQDPKPLSPAELEAFLELKGNSGSYMYMAPEAFRLKAFSEKSDVFAFGVMAYELLAGEMLLISIFNTGRAAKMGVRTPQGYAKLVADGYRPPRLQKLPDSAWALIEACWHQDPPERPSMAAVVQELQRITASELAEDGGAKAAPSASPASKDSGAQCVIC